MSKNLLGQISDIDLRLLKVFRTVVEAGGFAQAEVELNVSSSAISASMADLEKRLGLRLCQRGRAGFALTDEGRQAYQALLQLHTALDGFRTEINSIHQQLKGELVIGITDNLVTLPHMSVTRALAALKAQGPAVSIDIRMLSPGIVERGVVDGQLHLGVVPQVQKVSGLVFHPLYSETSSLYCSAEHPLFACDDADIDLGLLARQEAVGQSFAPSPEMKKLLEQLNVTARASDREGIAFMILTGLYLGFLPDHYAERWVQSGQMRALCPRQMSYEMEYAAITRKGVRPNMVLDTFLQALALGQAQA
ncbi:LysR family transcriptional regulator [Marinobacterium lutimaris]|uniref:Transcriptional regulator, LysR family n=1 Tax=Marinobacterium lutimaris TaxID=568106 RepID=A0A1H6BLE2_9GAMM|nr:LysR family transcriptional regulator [Marinobacterium lutimaris]SEG61016.1 transcriptional regulator, LysR family [Marinobacterium lutimaris]